MEEKDNGEEEGKNKLKRFKGEMITGRSWKMNRKQCSTRKHEGCKC